MRALYPTQAAVDGLVALKKAAMLTDSDVAEALKERAERIYAKCVITTVVVVRGLCVNLLRMGGA